MQFIKRWIYWHNFELGFIVNIDLWIAFCDKFWSADLMAHTPTHEWQVSLQSTYTWILYTLWTLLSYVKINIEYPVNPSCFQVLPPSLYTKLSTSSRRTLVVTTTRIRPHFCVIHINIISLHKLTHCVRDSIDTYVVVRYGNKLCPGLVIDEDGSDVQVQCIHKICTIIFYWPPCDDMCWYSNGDSITEIPPSENVTSHHLQIHPGAPFTNMV